jgi:GNAT superfamily N-acetyltransferase
MTDAARPWRIERYRDGDETAVLALFTDVFRRPRTVAHWTWQMKRNPYGGPFVAMARRTGDGAIVGINGAMSMKLNLAGRPVLICQSVDTAVHPEHRGQGVFENTARECFEWARSQGAEAVIGFPNPTSYPGLVRSLGWDRVLFPTQYKMRLSVRAELAEALGSRAFAGLADALWSLFARAVVGLRHALLRRVAGPGVRYVESAAVPAGYEALWNAWRAQEMLSVWKDTEYLRWRYDDNPDHRFTYHHLERGGEMVALAVTVEIDRATAVCEFLVRDRDASVGRLLASELCDHARKTGRTSVSFLGHDVGFFDDSFCDFDRRIAYSNVLCAQAFGEGRLAHLLPHADNWTITFGDGDFV